MTRFIEILLCLLTVFIILIVSFFAFYFMHKAFVKEKPVELELLHKKGEYIYLLRE